MPDPRLVTAARVDDDAQDEAGLRPRLLDEYIGQELVRENLQVAIAAAKQRTEPLDHVLLHGPPGLGKTTLAYVIANEMGVPIRATSGPAIEKPGDLVGVITNLAAGKSAGKLTEVEVLEIAAEVRGEFTRLIRGVIGRIEVTSSE